MRNLWFRLALSLFIRWAIWQLIVRAIARAHAEHVDR